MRPYVEPEHRELIDNAERMLHDYERLLLSKLESSIYYTAEMMEKVFYEDKMRQHLLRSLGEIKLICEKPRFLIKNKPNTQL